MGFYIDLLPVPETNMYRENAIPSVFWVLYGIAGFALLCMGLAAYSVLGDLLRIGSTFDMILLSLIASAIPVYLAIGIKLLFIRKFVDFSGENLVFGFQFGKARIFEKKLSKSAIQKIFIDNKRPSPNVAVRVHEDSQYHLQGHWRVRVESNGKIYTLDKNTDRAALEPLFNRLQASIK